MIFVVIAVPGNESILAERIHRLYGEGKSIELHPKRGGEWLVAAKATTTEVADRLGITADNADDITGIVLGVDGYWGREPENVWEWMSANGDD